MNWANEVKCAIIKIQNVNEADERMLNCKWPKTRVGMIRVSHLLFRLKFPFSVQKSYQKRECLRDISP